MDKNERISAKFRNITGRDEISSDILKGFNAMPTQAQGLLLSCLDEINRHTALGIEDFLDTGRCNSPIEYIYIIALFLAYGMRFDELWAYYDDGEVAKSINIEAFPQHEITVDGNTYFADFLLYIEYFGGEIKDTSQVGKIVIECDGFEYHHATKEQVTHDNERELAIKKAGYDILRFSGSQIYNDPFKCANATIDYIIADMERNCLEVG